MQPYQKYAEHLKKLEKYERQMQQDESFGEGPLGQGEEGKGSRPASASYGLEGVGDNLDHQISSLGAGARDPGPLGSVGGVGGFQGEEGEPGNGGGSMGAGQSLFQVDDPVAPAKKDAGRKRKLQANNNVEDEIAEDWGDDELGDDSGGE